jgi:glycosyltransferase involved in cell wall biosynthesis
MKVLLLDQFSELGGAQRMLLDLLPALDPCGWQAHLGLPGAGPLCRVARELGFEINPIDCGPYASGEKSGSDFWRFAAELPRLAKQIRTLARQVQPDLVYINGPRLLPAAAWAHLGRPVLFHAHSEISQGLARRLAGHSLARLKPHVVAVSRTVAEAWRPFAGGEVSVVYNGVAGPPRGADSQSAAPRLVSALGQTRTGPRIGCIGRIAPEKGQREFLIAAAAIREALPDARFVICGAPLFDDPAAKAYERQVREAAAALPVEFTGWVTDAYPVMQSLDLLLVTSVWNEPNPRVILEAFAAGLPLVAFRAGGIPEIVEHGRTGFLCDTPAEMAGLAIELLQEGCARLHAVAEAAREKWCESFTLKRWQGQMIAEIERAAG